MTTPNTEASPIEPKLRLGLKSGQALMAEGEAAFHEFVAQQLEPALGRTLPQMEVRCKGLSLVVEVPVSHQSTAPELPSIYNSMKHFVRKLTATKRVIEKQVLNGVDAVFEPGTITLVLGQPGSGKTSLMKVLSGQYPIEKNVKVTGGISYNGQLWEDLLPRLPQLAAYVPQTDKHFPSLSVQETLEFAHTCCAEELASRRGRSLLSNGTRAQNMAALRTTEALYQNYPDVIVEQLGLQMCRETVIGNSMIRGVSGGERRRVTTGEMEFGMKYATFMDEISTGLDSAATFDIVCTQRDIAKKLHKTVVMALLQPAPEVFELFDNILLLNDGEVMYHGPREHVIPYFESLGFVCPPDHDVADYLLDLGTDQQHQFAVGKVDGGCSASRKTPRLASEFAEMFRQSSNHQDVVRTLDSPWSSDRLHDAEQHLLKMPMFRQSFWAGTWTLILRQTTITLRNMDFIRVRALMVIVMGLIFGSTFYQVDPTNIQVSLGILYQSTMFLALGQSSQTPGFIAAREIYYKHRRANFYRASSFAIASLIALVPTSVVESVVLGSLVYWMCGFITEVGYYLLFLLFITLTNLALCGWFFTLTTMSANFNIVKPMTTFSIVFYIIFAGFVVPMGRIPDFFIWVYWVNPVAWCLRAVAVSQYRSPKFDVCVYAGDDYCGKYNMTMGEYLLSEYDVPSNKAWVWAGVLYLIFTNVFFAAVSSLILEYKRYDSSTGSMVVVPSAGDEEKTGSDELQQRDGVTSYVEVVTPRASIVPAQQENVVILDLQEEQRKAFVPVTLAFKDLWYSVPLPHRKHESIDLLKGISGYALPGTMTALMGSSGAGKTTLMDVIAGRKTGGTIRGEILLNGYPATELAIRRCTGYCEQMDIHSDAATIREALTFSAFLRQDSSVSEYAKLASVEECLDLLGMRAIADHIIRGRSQEQMKRLTIGVELAAQPSVLFLDEPTSGLDAHSAKVIMDGVRKVTDSGRTIVCTIHQPSSDVFFLFDSLLLLKRGGEMVFFGELDNAQPDDRECGHLIDYFEAIPGVAPLPDGQNPATWMLECIGAGVAGAGEKPLTDADTNVDFVLHFRESDELQALLNGLNKPGITTPSPDLPELVFTKKRAATSMTQLRMLVGRFLMIYWRTPSYNMTRFITALVLGFVFGLVLVNGEYTTYQGLNAAVGVIFMTTQYNGIIAYVGTLPFTGHERESYYRERASQTYNTLWYFIGGTIAEIPSAFFTGFLFTAIFYPLMGFTSFTAWVLYWINLSLFILMQAYIGQLFIYALPTVEVAAIVGVMINATFLLFAGFNPPAGSIPAGYQWLYYITPQRYTLSILISILFGRCSNDPTYDEATQSYINIGSELGCQPVENTPLSIGHTTVKGYMENVYDMRYDDLWSHFGCVFIFLFVFRLISLVSLRYINHQKR